MGPCWSPGDRKGCQLCTSSLILEVTDQNLHEKDMQEIRDGKELKNLKKED